MARSRHAVYPGLVQIRDAQSGDADAIGRLHVAAFGGDQEAKLVDALRSASAVTLSLVAIQGSEIVGHILFSPVEIASGEHSFDAIGLGPMAVVPDAQRRGIGSALVHAGLQRLREAGHDAVFVLGHPEYYPRFGFRRASDFEIAWEHEALDEAFMALELKPRGLAGRQGIVRYRPEFDQV